jgi:hypothetical protein
MVTIGRLFRAICSAIYGLFAVIITGSLAAQLCIPLVGFSCGRVILAPYHSITGFRITTRLSPQISFVSLGGYWPYSYRYHDITGTAVIPIIGMGRMWCRSRIRLSMTTPPPIITIPHPR